MKTGASKVKMESHLTVNLKRKINELKIDLTRRTEEVESLKRNIKSTKLAEFEVEFQMYQDECTRMRH